MDRPLIVDGPAGQKLFRYDRKEVSLAQLAQLRRIIMDDVRWVAFDGIDVRRNISSTDDKVFMYYLANVNIYRPDRAPLRPIEPPKEIAPFVKDAVGSFLLRGAGDKILTTNDVIALDNPNGFTLEPDHPLCWLRKNEEVEMVVYVREGSGAEFVSFRPTTWVFADPMTKDPTGSYYQLTVESKGPLSPEEIVYEARELQRATEGSIAPNQAEVAAEVIVEAPVEELTEEPEEQQPQEQRPATRGRGRGRGAARTTATSRAPKSAAATTTASKATRGTSVRATSSTRKK